MPENGLRIIINNSDFMTEHSICLNCEVPIAGKFCANCGQKTDTHRITFKHFIFHDIIHGVWHIEKGIIFTLKEALLRPGKAAIDYISGKRIKYYNIFYLILIFVGLSIVIEDKIEALDKAFGITILDESDQEFGVFLQLYSKLMIISFVPIFALLGFVLFKKTKYNFSEHCIIAGMNFLGIMIIYVFTLPLTFFAYTKNFDWITEIYDTAIFVVLLLFIASGYYHAIGKNYSKSGFLWRISIFLMLIIAKMILVVFLIIKMLDTIT